MNIDSDIWDPNQDFDTLKQGITDSSDLDEYVSRLVGRSWIPKRLQGVVSNSKAKKIRKQISRTNDVDEFQELVGKGVEFIIDKTTDGLVVNSLDNLEQALLEADGRGILFLSTHNDAFMEASLVSWVLRNMTDSSTAHSAFGDSFLEYGLIGKAATLNKGFPVYRGGEDSEAEVLRLSEAINGLLYNGRNVWLANQFSRTRTQDDRTRGITGMLYKVHEGKHTISEWLDEMVIVPVTVSYEWVPNDYLFAVESYFGVKKYKEMKPDGWDERTYENGLFGSKGDVHITFGHRIEGEFEDVRQVRKAADVELIGNKVLFASNYVAYNTLSHSARSTVTEVSFDPTNPDHMHRARKIEDASGNLPYTEEDLHAFTDRLHERSFLTRPIIEAHLGDLKRPQLMQLETDVRRILLRGYANPVINMRRYDLI